jgi:drug/metabolite transporter (DMT)-like permease
MDGKADRDAASRRTPDRDASTEANPLAYLLLTLTALCWAMLRWLLVLALVAVVARGHVRRDWPLLRRHLPFLAAMGALGFTGFNAVYYVAAHYTTAVTLASSRVRFLCSC